MWNGKNKAVTFSFDDGVMQDYQLISVLNKCGLKATFNLNSSRLGVDYSFEQDGVLYKRKTVSVSEVKELYKGHEISAHTLLHTNLTQLNEESVVWQVEQDRKALSEIAGYEVKCMAYPCGGVNNDDRVAKIIKDKTNIKFARTITSTHNFDLQDNLFRFNPTVYWCEKSLYDIIDEFIALKTDKPQLLYIWGHSYELDYSVDIGKFENACLKLSEQSDIYFGTNGQTLLNK